MVLARDGEIRAPKKAPERTVRAPYAPQKGPSAPQKVPCAHPRRSSGSLHVQGDELERVFIEGHWKEFGQSFSRQHAIQVCQNHFNVAGKFPEQLPASAAGASRLGSVRDDANADELALPLG